MVRKGKGRKKRENKGRKEKRREGKGREGRKNEGKRREWTGESLNSQFLDRCYS